MDKLNRTQFAGNYLGDWGSGFGNFKGDPEKAVDINLSPAAPPPKALTSGWVVRQKGQHFVISLVAFVCT